jgi:O-acetyl-ADP-ribose deacetylase (regulator of RNase III)
MLNRIEIVEGDITKQNVEAIVNAANNSLLGGGGVDGAIHRAAGPALLEECSKLNGCATGDAKITKGYDLPAEWVIHTVGPVWSGGDNNEDTMLARCYERCYLLVEQYLIKTIAFPSISTGAYGFPLERASKIAITETKNFLKNNSTLEKVIFTCFDEKVYQSYIAAVDEIIGEG